MRAKMQIQSVTLNGYTEIVAMSAVYVDFTPVPKA